MGSKETLKIHRSIYTFILSTPSLFLAVDLLKQPGHLSYTGPHSPDLTAACPRRTFHFSPQCNEIKFYSLSPILQERKLKSYMLREVKHLAQTFAAWEVAEPGLPDSQPGKMGLHPRNTQFSTGYTACVQKNKKCGWPGQCCSVVGAPSQ